MVEDPLAPGQNVAASSFNYAKIASTFEDCYLALSFFKPTRFTPTLLSCILSRRGFEHSSSASSSSNS